MIVMKFGGTSVGDGERIRRVARIVRDVADGEAPRSVVVVSAMERVTDALIKAARASAGHDGGVLRHTAAELGRRHREAAEAVALPEEREALLGEVEAIIEEFENLCRAIQALGELTPRGLDAVASLGERLSVRLVAAAMRGEGLPAHTVEATELVVTDDNHGAASPLMEATRERVQALLPPLLDKGAIPVVTGFIGTTPEGATTTLGRGGSDYSAAILGACLDAEEIWIWSDVDGVKTADPQIVPEARTLAEISYAEAAELSYFGAKILHPKTILPAVERGIPIRIRNTFNPTGPSTLIVAQPKLDKRTVKGITSIEGLSLITVEGRGMLGVPGIAAKVFSAVASQEISVLMISQSSSEQSICFVIREEETDRALMALKEAFKPELAGRNVDRIWAERGVAIVAAVGKGMKNTPGIAAKVFSALGRRGINVISIAQGSSEYNISLVVTEDEVEDAVRAIHSEFELGAGG
jgi:aspartate kinase